MISIRNLRRNLRKAREFPGYAARVLFKRARSTLSYYLGGGKSAPPETVSILLAYRCNLRCTMCGQWGEGGAAKGYTDEVKRQSLTLDDIKTVVDGVRGFTPAITLFGGEPLLYKDIVGALEIIKGARLRANIITNGTLLSRWAPDLVRLGLDEVIFSLDGPPKVHDRVRNRAGVFTDAAAGFRLLAEAKQRSGSRRPVVNVNSTIFDFNYRQMKETLDTARSLGAEEVTFHHLIFISRKMYAAHQQLMLSLYDMPVCDWEGFAVDGLPDIDPDILIAGLSDVRERGASVYPNLTDDEVRDYYGSFEFTPKSYAPACMSPWMVAYIFPDGTVRPCLSNGVVMGNVREEPFSAIWNNDRYVGYRREIKRRGYFPACVRCTELYRF
ncbi:MAG: radical SAM protein [Deltaproteobacteria bacterium]|nr:radical SAM protein [Candidatus Zymogenaceae bacterium]